MRKVSLWRRIGTRGQLIVVFVLLLALGASIFAIIQSESSQRSSSGNLPFVLLPPTPAPAPLPMPEIILPDLDDIFTDGFFDSRPISLLTGFHVEEEDVVRRPIAVVINNSFGAHPQSGIAYADVIYEVLAEGTTTRLVAIFQSSVPEKIGPVRSTRDYFVDFALNHDAFFVHHGGSPSGYDRVRRILGVNAIDGMRFEGTVFWRDRSFPYWASNTGQRSVEHSSFTGKQELFEHIESMDIRGYFNGDVNQNPGYGFNFGDVPIGQASIHSDISNVVIPFANATYTSFTMDYDTGHYFVSHARGPWLDAIDMAHVKVANVLVQHTGIWVVDNEGRRSVTTVGSGTGYLVRDGLVFNVRWEKSSHASPMQWFFEDGTPLVLASGRTWINVLQTSAQPEFHSEAGAQHGA